MPKTKHSLTRVPTHFRLDSGDVYPINILKVNFRTLWIKLVGAKYTHKIKVRKSSKKLVYDYRKEVIEGEKTRESRSGIARI